MIENGVYKGIKSIVIENEFLKINILPEYGGKMASLINKGNNREILFQSQSEKLEIPEYSSSFSEYDSSGFDEVFPSINACLYPDGEYIDLKIPDHGEVWAMPWEASISEDEVLLSVSSQKFNYSIEKKIRLNKNKVEIKYIIKNLGEHDFKFIWTPHALLNCTTESRIIVPNRLNKVMNVEEQTEHLGEWGSIHDYPMTLSAKTNDLIDLSKVEGREVGNCEKFYFLETMKKDEACGVDFPDTGDRIIYRYDTEKVPYLGIWKTQGGYRGDYNIALEPCTGVYDDLNLAAKLKKVPVLKGNSTYEWNFSMEITNRT